MVGDAHVSEGASAAPTRAPTRLRLFNTLTRRVEEVEPLEPGRVRLYSCGPTVYRYVHIGNLRSFMMADWIRRALVYDRFAVRHIKNITDVGHMRQDVLDRGEDKLVAQALREGKTPWEIAAFYTDAFMRDEALLNILPAHAFPRATDHIPDMISITETLLAKGYAYEVSGNVFFAVAAFPDYGRLSGNRLELQGQGMHTASELDDMKRAPEDFPLWKAAELGRVMAWESPWGTGFPGWHIECSAMSAKHLGAELDIHTGGVDNIFPHHEDERAQSEAASGQRFVRLWVHGQHVLADGLKMAKSAGNAYTLADLEARGFEPLALRYLFTQAKYRTRLNFTFRALRAAEIGLERLRERAAELHEATGGQVADPAIVREQPYHRAFLAAMRDDLNLPRAMAVVHALLRDATVPPDVTLGLLYAFDEVLGFDLKGALARRARERRVHTVPGREEQSHAAVVAHGDTPEPVVALARDRARARLAGDFTTADLLRAEIAGQSYAVRDGHDQTWLQPRREQERFISSSRDVPSQLDAPDRYAFSVALLAHNNHDDLARCMASVVRHAAGRAVELVIVDSGSTDETYTYLQHLARDDTFDGLPLRVLFADHDLGFAAARNAALRASLGCIVILLDTSIELVGAIWAPIEALLADPSIGLVGPYGLVSDDLKEFREAEGPEVDAIEGYLMAFRRATLLEVGPAYEKFRFYRLMDIDYSFEFKRAGFRVVACPNVAARITRHAHREWESLSEDERATKSKKNFDLYYKRRHHAQSLLVRSFQPGQTAPWSHDPDLAAHLVDARFERDHLRLASDAEHTHEHRHWPDHAHTHRHRHLQPLQNPPQSAQRSPRRQSGASQTKPDAAL